jgi:hypothetical protein
MFDFLEIFWHAALKFEWTIPIQSLANPLHEFRWFRVKRN